ncbi:MAG: HipA domain-containing protein [Defluviitaleaceae bacterium]|nr:HipA domain-containing protein [Defluviitaleaceae bacterium]
MINFDKGDELLNKFAGSEAKTTIRYENEVYMIKYPDPIRQKKNLLSYMNNQYSEHIGCCIFRACGMEAQETALGYYTDLNGKRKIVVGCKDFTQNGATLYEFGKLGNQVLVEGKTGITIESVTEVINRSNIIKNKDEILDRFWDMFVVDCLIGNSDRHFDNWGVIDNDGEIKFAPVYDCGSALSALVDDDKMALLLTDPVDFKNQEYNRVSCYYMNNKKVYYHDIFSNPPEALASAILRIAPKIDMDEIHGIIDSTPCISDVRKDYLKKALDLRFNEIIIPALKRIKR